jgi:YVTN family beta-propeller protein
MFSELLRVSTALVFAAAPVLAQGTGAYFNVESPQRKPITVARVAGHDYLVACNTPDNCVEIYDTHKLETDLPNAFLLRVQTGAEPISVVYNGELGRLFTCNFLGDSVSMIALSATGSSGPLSATLLRTTTVGDEPNHIAFAADNASLYVTLGSQGQISRRSTTDLSPVGSGTIDLLDNMTLSSATKALGSPSIALRQGNQLFVLANRGGKALVPPFNPNPDYSPYDFDVWTLDLTNNTSVTQITGLGTANFNMAFSKAGDLWVVGTDAQFDVRGESAVATTAFGFVRSKIYRIANPGAGATAPTEERDLNKNPSGAQVTKARALGQPTDLALYEPGATLQKVYVAAFNSDLVGSITPVGSASTWVITPITIPKYGGSTNPRSGPRGLAIKYVDGVQYDPGNRIYVLNRLDNAISVIDPSNDAVLLTFALRRDPTPQYIRTGRKFLYGANLSGSGIVSCASCHVDGRSDWLNWDLNGPGLQMFPTNANNQVTIDLAGQAVFVRKGSAYAESLDRLNEQLKARGKPAVVIDEAPGALEDDDVLEMVNAGLAPITVVDDYLAAFWSQVFTSIKVHGDVAVRSGGNLAVAFRKENPRLRQEVNKWIRKHGKGDAFRNTVERKYLQNVKYVKNAAADAERRKLAGVRELFQDYFTTALAADAAEQLDLFGRDEWPRAIVNHHQRDLAHDDALAERLQRALLRPMASCAARNDASDFARSGAWNDLAREVRHLVRMRDEQDFIHRGGALEGGEGIRDQRFAQQGK